MSLIGIDNEEKIWNYFYEKIKNQYGVAGLMGNLYAESGLQSNILQISFQKSLNLTSEEYTKRVDNNLYTNFVNDKAGYGLAQWTYYSRKQNLLNFIKQKKKSIGDLETQLDFLYKELKENFTQVLKILETTNDILSASNAVLLDFERPAKQDLYVQVERRGYCQNYFDKYGKKGDIMMSNINIIKCYGITNTTYMPNRKVEWIAIHYTAGTTSKKGSAINLATWYKGGTGGTSSDFVIDDATIVQYNEDINHRYTWGVGGNKYSQMSTSLGGKYYNIATNKNCINIEICSNKVNTKTLLATDDDWYFTEAEIDNAVKLVQYLMEKFNIDIDHVIMHHHVTGKVCPNPWTLTEKSLSGWYDFLNKVQNKIITTPIQIPFIEG